MPRQQIAGPPGPTDHLGDRLTPRVPALQMLGLAVTAATATRRLSAILAVDVVGLFALNYRSIVKPTLKRLMNSEEVSPKCANSDATEVELVTLPALAIAVA
jgi:hypothetical protein